MKRKLKKALLVLTAILLLVGMLTSAAMPEEETTAENASVTSSVQAIKAVEPEELAEEPEESKFHYDLEDSDGTIDWTTIYVPSTPCRGRIFGSYYPYQETDKMSKYYGAFLNTNVHCIKEWFLPATADALTWVFVITPALSFRTETYPYPTYEEHVQLLADYVKERGRPYYHTKAETRDYIWYYGGNESHYKDNFYVGPGIVTALSGNEIQELMDMPTAFIWCAWDMPKEKAYILEEHKRRAAENPVPYNPVDFSQIADLYTAIHEKEPEDYLAFETTKNANMISTNLVNAYQNGVYEKDQLVWVSFTIYGYETYAFDTGEVQTYMDKFIKTARENGLPYWNGKYLYSLDSASRQEKNEYDLCRFEVETAMTMEQIMQYYPTDMGSWTDCFFIHEIPAPGSEYYNRYEAELNALYEKKYDVVPIPDFESFLPADN